VYEQAIAAAYYAIFEPAKATLELYRLEDGHYVLVPAKAAGRFPVKPLGVELGVWQGSYQGQEGPWLRVWDAATGHLVPTAEERAEAERQRAEAERQRAESEKRRAETAEHLLDDTRRRLDEECERAEDERRRAAKLAERLRAMGVDPDAP